MTSLLKMIHVLGTIWCFKRDNLLVVTDIFNILCLCVWWSKYTSYLLNQKASLDNLLKLLYCWVIRYTYTTPSDLLTYSTELYAHLYLFFCLTRKHQILTYFVCKCSCWYFDKSTKNMMHWTHINLRNCSIFSANIFFFSF